MKLHLIVIISSSLLASQIDAKEASEKWDVNAPKGAKLREVPIKVNEGSWIDLDVSADGKTLVFSLLGDIYTMPITGGTPNRISDGLAWEVQPRFSPDDKRIAFTSDRGGGDNIWIMNRDGSDKRQVTKESFQLLNHPSWSPNGEFITARKHFTTQRSLGTGEVWIYHMSGGNGVALVKKPNDKHQKELGEPIFAPDGKSIYYSRNITPGTQFEYAQDSNTDLFNINAYNLESGETSTVVYGLGGSVCPTPSPDGKRIAFIRRERAKSKLYVKDFESGKEYKIFDLPDQDMMETWAVTGVYPNMDWTPDSKTVIFWSGGKIRKVDIASRTSSIIPFTIDDTRSIAEAPHPIVRVSDEKFAAKMPRFASVSPDGRMVVFESLGKLYTKPMTGGDAKRLTGSREGLELFPSWSRDNRSIVYVHWTDKDLGQIKTVSASGGSTRTITDRPGHYAYPQFSPDQKTIVFEMNQGGYLTSPLYSVEPGIYRVSLRNGSPVQVIKGAKKPQFGGDNDRIFAVSQKDGKLSLISSNLEGEAKRVHATGELINDFIVSPDGRFSAFRQSYEAYVMPLMPGAQSVEVGPKSEALPIVRVSANGADYIHWSEAGGQLHWSIGPTVYTSKISEIIASAPLKKDEQKFLPPKTGVSIERLVNADLPKGKLALVGARLITMADKTGGIINDGVLLVEGNRITAVGKSGEVTIPAGAVRFDVAGKTIIPGLIDAHAHGAQGADELVPQQNWSLLQNLALGTTTIHDPSSAASEIFVASQMQRAGILVGPRIFSTGEIVYGAKSPNRYAQIDSLDDALNHVRRLKEQGGGSVKNYNQPRREQRQQVAQASRQENMQVVAEGGSLFGMDMTLIADGNSTLEHNVPLTTFYNDVLQFFSQSQTNYTPTLVVSYSGMDADSYWRQATDVFRHPLLIHTPPKELAAASVRRIKAPEEDFADAENAREAKKLADRGVLVSIGGHGQQAGIAVHWELWSFVRGGMSPLQALQTGTINAAKSLGMAKEIGSLEQGKLADMVILEANPIEDIRNSDKVVNVMVNGRLYDSVTMNEIVPEKKKRLPYWWEEKAQKNDT